LKRELHTEDTGAPSTGGDPQGDLQGDPRAGAQGDLLSAADVALYQDLRVWRAEVADVAGIPVFMILANRQLRDIVRLRPASLAALRGISGIGQARLQKYGRVLLERVRGGAVAGAPVSNPEADADRPPVTEELGSAPMSDPSSEIPAHA
jgi:ATP-dependent DNA helicase RecQ